TQLHTHLTTFLPHHMTPSALILLNELPVTVNGKLDREALPAPGHAPPSPGREPATELEARLCEVFAEILAVERVGADDDFFVLGGHSLLVVRLLARVRAGLGVRIGVRDFLAAPTAGRLAELVESGRAGRTEGAGPVVTDAEARLGPGMRFPAAGAPRDASGPRRILLTGATGFVGAFLLRELLERTERTGTELLCLVRGASAEAARARLADATGAYGLGAAADDPRVRVVRGDLAEPGLGTGPGRWHRLAEEVDTVVHAGAHVHHLSSYERLKPANVGGTRELLRLLAEGRPKRLHHVSTLGVFRGGPGPRLITEDSDTSGERHPSADGYAAGKWVADRMVQHAVARGADARVYRLGRVWADTRRGVVNPGDLYCRLLATCAALGRYPLDAVATHADLLPVDVAARALAALVLDEEGTTDATDAIDADRATGSAVVHHLHHARPTGAEEFLGVHDALHGTRTEPVPLGAWLRLLRETSEAGRELPFLPYLDAFEEYARAAEAGTRPAGDTFRSRRTLERLERLGVTVPDIDTEMITAFWRGLPGTGPDPR
ncbi:thioester reductase domain-containing protein, partial [Streptomyces sp. Ru87]|uniref:thioester reductase domain-containing protein n=1 Tax=Streptomyces sp. Ru87 TaxID=2044307 RepID=UPI000C01C1CB